MSVSSPPSSRLLLNLSAFLTTFYPPLRGLAGFCRPLYVFNKALNRPLSHTDHNKQFGNKKIAERSKCVCMSNQLCNLGVTYPSHSVQICRSNKTILNRQRTSSCQTLHCPSCAMMDSPRLATLQADRDPRPIVTNQPGCQRDRS
jgi:hypothetical protein